MHNIFVQMQFNLTPHPYQLSIGRRLGLTQLPINLIRLKKPHGQINHCLTALHPKSKILSGYLYDPKLDSGEEGGIAGAGAPLDQVAGAKAVRL